MSRHLSGKNIESRKESAKDRSDASRNLTIDQKIAKLDSRLGKGIGAKRERARLAGQLATLNAPKENKENIATDNSSKDISPKKKYARKYSGKDSTK